LVPVLRGSRDARDADALADALLNPRDRSYSVPQLLEFVSRNGLAFGRWYRQAPYLPHCGALSRTPHAPTPAALAPPEQYAAMELWRGTMAAHSAVVYGSETAGAAGVRFDDERSLRFVPIRRPSTQLILERLPANAAGVLLNRGHQHPDLIVAL